MPRSAPVFVEGAVVTEGVSRILFSPSAVSERIVRSARRGPEVEVRSGVKAASAWSSRPIAGWPTHGLAVTRESEQGAHPCRHCSPLRQAPGLRVGPDLSLVVVGIVGYSRLGVDRYPKVDFRRLP
jgi:hypothetical protein